MSDKNILGEEQESLVHNTSSEEPKHSNELIDSSRAISEGRHSPLEDYQDPWASKNDTLISLEDEPKTVNFVSVEEDKKTTLISLEENEEDILQDLNIQEPIQTKPLIQEEILDRDTSAVKGFQNVDDTDQIDDLVVHGKLPDWLLGEYFSVGPCTYDIKYLRKIEIDGELQNSTAVYTFQHWFDALPLVNRFDLNGTRNTVTYRNRSTSKRLVSKIREHHGFAPQHPNGLYMSNTNQTVLTKLLGTKSSKPDAEPCSARVLSYIPGLDGRLFALNYANHIQELDPFDLKPKRLFTWGDINPKFKGTSSCPNGQFDPLTGEYINFTLEMGYQNVKYNFFSISDRHPKGVLIGSVIAPMAYINSFSITRKYIIFVICPMLANAGGSKYNWNESIMDSFSFDNREPTLFYVISRESGEVLATYRSDPCFVFHHINAFEELDTIYLDMICYPDDTIARQLQTEYLRNPHKMKPSRLVASEVRRYKLSNISDEKLNYLSHFNSIPSKTTVGSRLSSVFGLIGNKKQSTIEGHNISATNKWYSWMSIATFDKRVQPSIELPQINPNFNMFKHTFMYGLGFSASNALNEGAIWDSIVKINTNTKQVVASWHQDFCYPSESIFIPRPPTSIEDTVEEDDGVLLTIILNSAKAKSFLLVLDTKSFEVIATADIERLIPISFAHGSYRLLEYQ